MQAEQATQTFQTTMIQQSRPLPNEIDKDLYFGQFTGTEVLILIFVISMVSSNLKR